MGVEEADAGTVCYRPTVIIVKGDEVEESGRMRMQLRMQSQMQSQMQLQMQCVQG